jgi:hypothetical protein
LIQVFFPLHREKVLLPVIALFTAGNHIIAGGFPPARDRYDVIHGQIIGSKGTTAPITLSHGHTVTPPAAAPQFTSFFPLAADFGFAYVTDKIIQKKLPDIKPDYPVILRLLM